MLSFPGVKSYQEPGGCESLTWMASGAGSTLNLLGLTNVLGGNCGSLQIQAMNGGLVMLSNVVAVLDGKRVRAGGMGPTVWWISSGLVSYAGANYTLSMEASGAGNIPLTKFSTISAGTVQLIGQALRGLAEYRGSIWSNARLLGRSAVEWTCVTLAQPARRFDQDWEATCWAIPATRINIFRKGRWNSGGATNSSAMSCTDLGNITSGFSANFAYGSIVLDPGAPEVTLVDQSPTPRGRRRNAFMSIR